MAEWNAQPRLSLSLPFNLNTEVKISSSLQGFYKEAKSRKTRVINGGFATVGTAWLATVFKKKNLHLFLVKTFCKNVLSCSGILVHLPI